MSESQFIETPVPATVSKGSMRKLKNDALKKYDTRDLLWFVVKRHKFGLVVTWAVLITIDHFVPFAKDVVLSIFN